MRNVLVILLALLGVSALWGGAAFVNEPDGSTIQAPLSLLDRTPFDDFFWPGILLGGVFGLGGILSALLVFANRRFPLSAALLIGLALVLWIAYQLLVFPEYSLLQPILLCWGLAIVWVAWRIKRIPER